MSTFCYVKGREKNKAKYCFFILVLLQKSVRWLKISFMFYITAETGKEISVAKMTAESCIYCYVCFVESH